MEKETKVIKERFKSLDKSKIESIAAAMVEEEIGEELVPKKPVRSNTNCFKSTWIKWATEYEFTTESATI